MATVHYKFSFFFNIFLLSLFLLPTSMQAKTMVLIHGHLANGMLWRTSEVTKGLILGGWKDGGGYGFNQQGVLLPNNPKAKPNAFFTVDLPSKAPISVQTHILGQYLEHLYAIRKEPIVFVGHSSGGIVARLYLINPAHVPATSLITIGTPHLGTPIANIAYSASDSPLGIILDIAGQNDIRDSRGLYADLKTANPNTFLYWLNRQTHPRIAYVSVIRSNEIKTKINRYDFIVPSDSQNMNNTWALKGLSLTYLTQENHFLSAKDGLFLIDILKRLSKM